MRPLRKAACFGSRALLAIALTLGIFGCDKGASKGARPATAGSAVDGAPGLTADMTPQQRLDASLKVYRSAATYRDEGAVSVEGYSVPFSTAFERGARFRFRFRFARDPKSGIATSGPLNRTGTLWSTNGKEFQFREDTDGAGNGGVEANTVGMLIATATGISGGSAGMVLPVLLSSDIPGVLEHLSDLKEAGTEPVDGVECWKIKGATQLRGFTMTVWIGADGLVRRVTTNIDRKPAGGDSHLPITQSMTITFKPVLNESKVADSLFEVK